MSLLAVELLYSLTRKLHRPSADILCGRPLERLPPEAGENWHTGYAYPGNFHTNCFDAFRTGQTDGRADGRARRVMRSHNNLMCTTRPQQIEISELGLNYVVQAIQRVV